VRVVDRRDEPDRALGDFDVERDGRAEGSQRLLEARLVGVGFGREDRLRAAPSPTEAVRTGAMDALLGMAQRLAREVTHDR
jgi:hypothetical protein